MAEPYDASMAVAQAEAVIAFAQGAAQAERARDIALVDEAEARARTTELLAYVEALTTYVTTLEARLADLRAGESVEERQLRARMMAEQAHYEALQEQTRELDRNNQRTMAAQYAMIKQSYAVPLEPKPASAYLTEMVPAGGPGISGEAPFAPALEAPEPEAPTLRLDTDGYPLEADDHAER